MTTARGIDSADAVPRQPYSSDLETDCEMLSKDANQRFDSMKELNEALMQVDIGFPETELVSQSRDGNSKMDLPGNPFARRKRGYLFSRLFENFSVHQSVVYKP